MASKYQAYMNGISLTGLDERIHIVDVRENETLNIASAAKSAFGKRVTFRNRESLTISIDLMLKVRCSDDYAVIIDKIHAWAVDGFLELSYRPFQQIHCICTTLPGIASIHKWTSTLTLVFTAYDVPYWVATQDTVADVASSNNTTKTINVPGSRDTALTGEVKNLGSDVCNTLSISSGNGTFSFDGLGLASGETLVISYTAEHILRLSIVTDAGVSRTAYDKRTAQSDDDIILKPGANILTLTADTQCKWTISARGRWL